jgi:hypothetical protein
MKYAVFVDGELWIRPRDFLALLQFLDRGVVVVAVSLGRVSAGEASPGASLL